MRRMEEVKETVKRERLRELVCDLCGTEAVVGKRERPDGGTWPSLVPPPKWSTNPRLAEITVQMTETWYGDWEDTGSERTVTSFDLCPVCFGRLVEWLKAQGAEPTIRETEY